MGRRFEDVGAPRAPGDGSASVAEALFDRAGIRDHFETLLSVERAGVWKPAPGAYAYALEQCGVEPTEAMLVGG